MRILSISLAFVLATSAAAQTVQYESVTGAPWSHTAAGTWKNGVNDPRSSFGKLDNLVSANSFTYTRAPLNLGPGTYIADVRWAKAPRPPTRSRTSSSTTRPCCSPSPPRRR
jgi:hypothetical protein